MQRLAGGLGFVLIVGLVVYRLFFWGADVAEYVQTGQQNELVKLSNLIVDPLDATTDTVHVIHDLLRRASDPANDDHKGAVLLLEISGEVLPERIAEARTSIQSVDLTGHESARDLVEAADKLLDLYEGFLPTHNALSIRILEMDEPSLEVSGEVEVLLRDLEISMADAIEVFSISQSDFLG